MNHGKKMSWQVIAVSAAALLGGLAQADGRGEYRDRGDDSGWRQTERRSYRDDSRHERGWHNSYRRGNGPHRPHHRYVERWLPPHHWHHRHHSRYRYRGYSDYRTQYWMPQDYGAHVVISLPLY
ncbi:MAG: hypothetical protein H7Y02_13340 [Candidatus Obscuribacterales bacterium]|nr:hypothetical protein [Steroidobacteraceae bacterium]